LFTLIKYFEGCVLMGYIFIDKNIYFKNKRLIDNFIDQEEKYIPQFYLEMHSDKIECVEIYVESIKIYDCFVEDMFRKLGKDIIACVGLYCVNFKKLKEMNVMISEIHEKMWVEKDRWGMMLWCMLTHLIINLFKYYTITLIYIYLEDVFIIQNIRISVKRLLKGKSTNTEDSIMINYIMRNHNKIICIFLFNRKFTIKIFSKSKIFSTRKE
jgi:hypothetical protein